MIPRFVQRFAGAEMTAREALARVCTLVVKKICIFVIEIDLSPSLDIATRMKPADEQPISLESADSQLILLRVLGSSRLPNDIEMQQKRLDAAKRASDSPSNYDEDNTTDTLNPLRWRPLPNPWHILTDH